MNGFEIYKVYLAVKLHFTSKGKSYDFHKHGGRTTARLEGFTKRRDRYFFHKLSKSYNNNNIVDSLILYKEIVIFKKTLAISSKYSTF